MARRKRRRISSRRRHSLAAKRGWRGRVRRRGRRSRRNPGYGYNRRRYRRNPSIAAGLTSAPLAAFKMPVLTKGAVIFGGAAATGVVEKFLNDQVVMRFMPSIAGNRVGSAVVGLASAGLVGALAGLTPMTRGYAGDLLTGGVVKVASEVADGLGYSIFSGLGSLLDFATERGAMSAARVLSDFATERGASSARTLDGMSEQF